MKKIISLLLLLFVTSFGQVDFIVKYQQPENELILPSNQSTLEQVNIILAGMTSGYIDWGDGNVTNIVTSARTTYTHDYSTTGIYYVRIGGDINGLTKFVSEGQNHWEFDLYQFKKCTNLDYLGLLDCQNIVGDISSISQVTDYLRLTNCFKITGNISFVSNVTNYLSLFNCYNIIGDLSSVSGVANILSLGRCYGVTGDIKHIKNTKYIDLRETNVFYTSSIMGTPKDYFRANDCNLTTAEIDQILNDPGNDLFDLPVGSPCIDAGLDVGLTVDYYGNPIIGNPDIGAVEKQ